MELGIRKKKLVADFAFFNYINDNDLDQLITELRRIEDELSEVDHNPKGKELWFKFFADDTAATSIRNLEIDLALPSSHNNYNYMRELLKVSRDNKSLQIYFS